MQLLLFEGLDDETRLRFREALYRKLNDPNTSVPVIEDKVITASPFVESLMYPTIFTKKDKTKDILQEWNFSPEYEAELQMKFDFLMAAWASGKVKDTASKENIRKNVASYVLATPANRDSYAQLIKASEPGRKMKHTLLYRNVHCLFNPSL